MARSNINGDWFRQKLTEKQRSQRQLAKHLGLDPAAITLMFRGERRMQMDEAKQIASFLGEPLVDVLRAAGLPIQQGTPAANQITPRNNTERVLLNERAELVKRIEKIDQAINLLRS